MRREFFKKYRALGVIAAALIFNLVTSIMFAAEGVPFNKSPLTVGEWICDIISILILLFGMMIMAYDILSYKPKRVRTYKVNDEGKVTEIVDEKYIKGE